MNRCLLLCCALGVCLFAVARVQACDGVAVDVAPQACVATSVVTPVTLAPQVVVSPLVAVTPSVAVVSMVVPAVAPTQVVPVRVRTFGVRARVAPRMLGAGLLQRCRF